MRGEVAAVLHLRPAAEVGEVAAGDLDRGTVNLAREGGVGGGDGDGGLSGWGVAVVEVAGLSCGVESLLAGEESGVERCAGAGNGGKNSGI